MLGRIQGNIVPVYLGNIDLEKSYLYDVEVRIQHMFLISWAGETARPVEWQNDAVTMMEEIQQSINVIGLQGVTHGDLQLQRVMLIDFDRSTIMGPDDVKALVQSTQNATSTPK
ncbi:MAG: hypothetical protein M1825_005572 [Sarcosagium campestre]|nr:MAG: hypothetical protein M1825_005572 [Sarcosagium campestre]